MLHVLMQVGDKTDCCSARANHLSHFETGAFTGMGLPSRLDWLAREPQISACFLLSGITSVYHHAQLLKTWVLGQNTGLNVCKAGCFCLLVCLF